MFATLFCDVPVHATGVSIEAAVVTLYTDAACTAGKEVKTTTYSYTGSEIRPYVKVTYNGDVLQENVDYVIDSYNNNLNRGNANVVIRGTGTLFDATTTKTTSFVINSVELTGFNPSYQTECIYAGAVTNTNITAVTGYISGGGTIELPTSEYAVNYIDNTTVGRRTGKFQITLPTGNYVCDTLQTFSYSILYDMTASSVTVSGLTGLVYNGTAQTPDIVVSDTTSGGTIDSDNYTLQWISNTNAGTNTSSVNIVGQGIYTGTKTVQFSIAPLSISSSNVAINITPNQIDYTGAQIDVTSLTTILINSTFTVPNSNYDITYLPDYSQDTVGTTVARITGKNNLTGTATVPFSILHNLAAAEASPVEYTYTASGITPTFNVTDTSGALISNASWYSISYYNNADYSDAGTDVAPTGVGTYYVKLTGRLGSNCIGSVGDAEHPISYRIVPKQISDASIFLNNAPFTDSSDPSLYYTGSVIKPSVVVREGTTDLTVGVDYDIEYYTTSACTTIIENPLNVGTYYIKLTGKGSYANSEKILHYNIAAQQIAAENIHVTADDMMYTGAPITPTGITVTAHIGDADVEIASAGYTTACTNNTAIGTATLTITLTGNYTGTASTTFEITPKSLNGCSKNYETNDSILNATYNGNNQKPFGNANGNTNITFRDGSYTLVEGTDYTINCYNATSGTSLPDGIQNVGECKVRIVGINNYAGDTIELTYKIVPKNIGGSDIILTVTKPSYNSGTLSGVVTAYDNTRDRALVAGTDYTTRYFSDEACTIPHTGNTTSGMVYAQVVGAGNYTGTQNAEGFEIGTNITEAVRSAIVDAPAADLTYTGNSLYDVINDHIVVTKDSDGSVMTRGVDYNVTYYADAAYTRPIDSIDSSNVAFIHAGTLYYTIDGMGEYYGSYQANVKINAKSLADTTYRIDDFTYTGSAIRPQIVDTALGIVKGITVSDIDRGIMLDSNDYSIVTYSNNTSVSNAATVTIKGKGNYVGDRVLTFKIVGINLSGLVDSGLTVNVPEVTFNGMEQAAQPEIKYEDSNGITRTLRSADYTVEYFSSSAYTIPSANQINVGTRYLRIVGRGNYQGVLTYADTTNCVFVINPCDIGNANPNISCTLEGTTHKYSQIATNDKVPAYTITLTVNGNSYMLRSSDYSHEKQAPVDMIGDQTLIITGKGNFTGTRNVSYAYTGDLSTDVNLGDSISASYEMDSAAVFGRVEPVPKIYYGSQLLTNSDFEITYLNSDKVGEATIVIRAAESNIYWDGVYTKKYKIKGDIKNAEVIIPAQEYTGNPVTDLKDMKVVCNGFEMTLGTDFKIDTNVNNTKAALATDAQAPTVTLSGMGEFFDGHVGSTKVQTYDIKYDLTKANVSATTNKLWTGSEVTLDDLVVSYDTSTETVTSKVDFVEGRDYTVTYVKNVDVSAANGTIGPYAIITPTENGLLLNNGKTVNVPFSIGEVDISTSTITGVQDAYIYAWDSVDRDKIKPSTLQVILNGGVLDPSNYKVDYAVVPYDGTDEDIAAVETITITGLGNYVGTKTKQFNILKRDLSSDVTVTFTNTSPLEYSGQAQTPTYTVTYTDYEGRERTLPTKDYVVTWGNNVDAASADGGNAPYLRITADSNYCIGSTDVKFAIEPLEVSKLYYTPNEITDMVYTAGVYRYEPLVTARLSRNSAETLKSQFDSPDNPDFRITYGNNTGVMAATDPAVDGPHILITAKSSNFTGTYYIPFSITSRSLEIKDEETDEPVVAISLRDEVDSLNRLTTDGQTIYNYSYDVLNPTKEYRPVPDVVDRSETGENVVLTEGTDYTVTYEANNTVGTAKVIITGIGNYTGTRTVEFTIGTIFTDVVLGDNYNPTVGIESNILADETTFTYNGQAQTPEDEEGFAIYSWRNGNKADQLNKDVDYSIKYYSNPECTLETNCIHAGTVYMKITGEAAGGYVGSIVKSYTIGRKSINSADIDIAELEDIVYNGSSVVPRPDIIDTAFATESSVGTKINNECVYTYVDNAGVGTATLTVTGGENGNYYGSRDVHFRITRKNIGDSDVVVARIPDQTYTGHQITPSLVISYNGNILQAGTDYKLEYGNNCNAGIYNQVTLPDRSWVAVIGVGNYDNGTENSKIVYFNIKADLDSATVETITTQAYTGSQITPKVKVKCGGNTLIEGTDYTVVYDENTAIGEGALTILPTPSSCYTGSKTVKFYIGNSLATATVSNMPTSQTYTGKAIVPEPVVRIGNTTLVKGRDYSVQWKDNIKAGTAAVVVSGIGTYAGSKTVNYRIETKGIARCSISTIADIVYDGRSHSPTVIVRDGNKVLAQGTDYTLSNYSNNRLPGTATFTLTGIGNYSGSTTIKFNIIVANMAGVTAVPSTKSMKISWDARNNVTGYQVYTSNCRTKLRETTGTSSTIKKLKTGKNYTYKVRTYLKVGRNTYYGAFTTLKCTTRPSTATLKSVKSSKSRQAVIKWGRVSNAAGYEVYRSTSKNGKYTKVTTVTSKSKVSYTDKKLSKGKRYYYKVRTYRTVNGTTVYGSYSKTLSVKVK